MGRTARYIIHRPQQIIHNSLSSLLTWDLFSHKGINKRNIKHDSRYDDTSKRKTGHYGDIMDIKLEKIADNVANLEPRCLCWNIKFFCIAIVQSYFLLYLKHTTEKDKLGVIYGFRSVNLPPQGKEKIT